MDENAILLQILTELKELRHGQSDMHGDIAELKQGQAELKVEVQFNRNGIFRIELELMRQIQAAMDGGLLAVDLVKELKPRVEHLEEIAESHRVELMVLERKIENVR